MPNQEQLQAMMDNIEALEIGLNDGFRFSCRGCGQCCKHREDILLTPRDLFKIARHLEKRVIEIVETYCEVYVGGSSRIPIVRLMPKGKDKDCPLLQNNRCIVHASKPAVCALFPLGRFMQINAENADNPSDDDLQIRFLINENHCGGRQYNKVRRWLESFGIEPNDQVYLLWAKTATRLGDFIKNLENSEKRMPEAGFDAIWAIAYELLYMRYETDQEFQPQFEANIAEMWRIIDEMDARVIQPYLKGEAQ